MRSLIKTEPLHTTTGRTGRSPALYLLLSFLIPLLVILVALVDLRVTPFGENTLVISDANGLYINTLAYAGRMFRGLESAFYSFEKGLGGNMIGHFNGILLTPFGFLFSLSSIADYPTAFTFVSTLSLSLCGLTMYLLLADIYGHKRSHLIFSTCYALMGFNVANVFQAVFFCASPLLPLMILGLRRLLLGRNPLIYILSIACGMLLNAYFGFVLCAASVLFFFAGLFLYGEELKGKKLRTFVHYAISSLCGGLLSVVIWLPAFLSLQGGRLEQTMIADFSFWENMPFLEIGAKLFTGANSTAELVNGLPNIYVSILPLALAVLFFLSKEIGRKKKLAAGFLLGVYLLSFWIVAFNMLMHAGTTTNWFNYRYSYVFSFLLLLLAAELWQKLDDVSSADMKRCLIGMLLVTAVVFTKKYEFIRGGQVLMDYAILIVVFLVYRWYKKKPDVNPKQLFEVFVLLMVCINLWVNYQICTKNIFEWGMKTTEYEDIVLQVDPLVQALRRSDDSFFRMEVNRQRSRTLGNDPMLYGYDGVGHGGSNERNFVRKALSKLGIPWFDMRNYYADGVPAATDSLLGIKYVVSAEDLTEEKDYRNITNFEETQLFGPQDEYWDSYYNADALQVAVLSTAAIDGVETDAADVFENLNMVWSALSGEDRAVFIEEDEIAFSAHNLSDPVSMTARDARELTAYYDAKASLSGSASDSESGPLSLSAPAGVATEAPEFSSYIEYRFTAARDGAVFAYNRSALSDKNGSSTPVLTFVGRYQAGDEVVGYLPITADYVNQVVMEETCGRFHAAYADMETLHALSRLVAERPVRVEKQSETHLTGSFTAEQGQTLLFTIPWDEGWTCLLDGEPAALHMVLDVFMALDAPAGTHTYELKYTPPGLRIGQVISACALLLTIVYVSFGRKWFLRRTSDTCACTSGQNEPGEPNQADAPVEEDGEELDSPREDERGADAVEEGEEKADEPEMPPVTLAGRERGLDFVKILATLMIVLHHYQQVHAVTFPNGINFYYGKFYFGYLVELFFVISGYLMYRSIAKIRDGLRFPAFFLKKYLRFFPLMFLSVACYALLLYFFEAVYEMPWGGLALRDCHVVLPAFGVQAWISSTHQCANNPLWYINVLLLCCVFMYAAVRAAKRFAIPVWLPFCLFIVLGIAGFACGVDIPILNLKTERGFYSFFWGLLLAELLHRHRPSHVIVGACAVLTVGFPVLFALAGSWVYAGLNYTLTFLYGSAVIVLFTSDLAQKLFRGRIWETLADIAYNAYVWHSPLFILAALLFFAVRWVPDFSKATTVVCYVAGICLISAGLSYCLDKPTRKAVNTILERANRRGATQQ